MALEFFQFWVGDFWGGPLIALLGTAVLFYIIGLISRMSRALIISLMGLYFLVFGVGFYGLGFYLLAIFGVIGYWTWVIGRLIYD